MIDPKILFSEEAEKAVLGSMIVHSSETVDEVRVILGDDGIDFHSSLRREIYSSIIDLYDNGSGVELNLIVDYLRPSKSINFDILPGVLAELMNSFATHLNVTAYAKIVRNKKVLRDLISATENISKDITENPNAIASVIDNASSRINALSEAYKPSEMAFSEAVDKTASEINLHSKLGGGLMGLPTGFPKIDHYTGGWKEGQLIIIGARPSIGKSALALAFARALLRNQWNPEAQSLCDPGYPGGMFSLEMTHEELCSRLLAVHGPFAAAKFQKGELDETEQQKLEMTAQNIRDWKFYIDTQFGIDISQLKARARRWKRKYDIQWLIVDFLQLVQSKEAKKRGRTEEVTDIARELKSLAKELNIPIIALAQLNRDVKDEEPQLYHLKDSGAIEESADVVFLLHEHKEQTQHDGLLKYHTLHLAKQRNGVQNRRIDLEYRAWCTLFVEKKKD